MNKEEIKTNLDKVKAFISMLQRHEKDLTEEYEKSEDEILECYPAANYYYSMFSCGDCEHLYYTKGSEADSKILKRHLVFKTEEMAKLADEKAQFVYLMMYLKEQIEPDFKPDWNDHYQSKWITFYDHGEKEYRALEYCGHEIESAIYFSSWEKIQQAVNWLNARKAI